MSNFEPFEKGKVYIADPNSETGFSPYPPAYPIRQVEGTIDHPDGRVEVDGVFFEPVDLCVLFPNGGSPVTDGIPHEVVMAEMRERLRSRVRSSEKKCDDA